MDKKRAETETSSMRLDEFLDELDSKEFFESYWDKDCDKERKCVLTFPDGELSKNYAIEWMHVLNSLRAHDNPISLVDFCGGDLENYVTGSGGAAFCVQEVLEGFVRKELLSGEGNLAPNKFDLGSFTLVTNFADFGRTYQANEDAIRRTYVEEI